MMPYLGVLLQTVFAEKVIFLTDKLNFNKFSNSNFVSSFDQIHIKQGVIAG
jgi:hypothetical protein